MGKAIESQINDNFVYNYNYNLLSIIGKKEYICTMILHGSENAQIQGAMVTLAREARQMLQKELSERMKIDTAFLNRLENDQFNITPSTLEKLTQILQFPESFFKQHLEPASQDLAFRKRQKVPFQVINFIDANISIYRLGVSQLFGECGIKAPLLPKITGSDPKEDVTIVRKAWKLPLSPIEDLTQLIEKAGIPVIKFDFLTSRVDGKTSFLLDGTPIVFINTQQPPDRQRFTLAYELGLLLLYKSGVPVWDESLTHKANLFAAELLMPQEVITKEYETDVTINRLAELKAKWKVSMVSLLYRAQDVGCITEHQKLFQLRKFNQLNIRKNEPVVLPVEKPTMVRNLFTQIRKSKRYSFKELALKYHLYEEEFQKRYNSDLDR